VMPGRRLKRDVAPRRKFKADASARREIEGAPSIAQCAGSVGQCSGPRTAKYLLSRAPDLVRSLRPGEAVVISSGR